MKFKKPYIIAEISANHCGSFQKAKKLIKCAKVNGADAVKLQTYTADMMTLKSNKKYFQIKKGLWKGYNLWDLYKKAHTPLSWHKKLFIYAKKIGITIFSTPFSEEAVEFLEKLNCPFYKVASFEMTDIPLIEKIASTKKPIIISTGMANLNEIKKTVAVAKKNGAKQMILLYCVSNYPSSIKDFSLNNITTLIKKFKCSVGLSDHSKGDIIASLAVTKGADFFEKHIALEGQKKGVDIEFSAKGKEIKSYVETIKATKKIISRKAVFKNRSDDKMKIFRRSIFAIKDINKGEILTDKNIKRIRPGYGIEPKYYKTLIGKRSHYSFKSGEPITKKIFKK